MVHERLLTHVRDTAEAILDRLGSDACTHVNIIEVAPYGTEDMPGADHLILELHSGSVDADISADESLSHVRITLSESGRKNIGYALYPLGVSEPDAVVALASHIQDYIMEIGSGRPAPACPNHQHPMMAEAVDGMPVWRCPHDAANYAEPILGPPHTYSS
ncbi:hypothetical protein ACH35V_24200 [Actinomadura sp. 1N219]|uniref:hypothetical protein n=1 Tax=Actinomadura sp. 1N219 TaxID=3375152 RepID=UPI0037BD9A50